MTGNLKKNDLHGVFADNIFVIRDSLWNNMFTTHSPVPGICIVLLALTILPLLTSMDFGNQLFGLC